ncbi:MAG: hypothetical protein LC687_01010 [Actinobacteria bacterium]|nr:hypothetical protein [Actinomycetota bacterium]
MSDAFYEAELDLTDQSVVDAVSDLRRYTMTPPFLQHLSAVEYLYPKMPLPARKFNLPIPEDRN